jgi:pimeloyl-ACP methyl ester carboxylesterase
MTALFFGDSSSALFGVWTQPPAGIDRDHGVVLCPPIGQEHVRTHWALRQLAAALNRAGFHCLRFDWFGVGDSAGELRDASIDRWRTDLADATQELRDTAGVQKISVVGVRLGATIVALASSDVRPSSLVLWDPVVRGTSYIEELSELTNELLTDRRRYWNVDPERRLDRPTELVGFEYGARLVGELRALDLGVGDALPRVPTCLVRSSDAPALLTLGERLATRADVSVVDTEVLAGWDHPEEIERLLLPGDALRALAGFLEARAT